MDSLLTVLGWIRTIVEWVTWLGIGLIPFGIAVAIFLFVPSPWLRKWTAIVVVGWGLWFVGYTLGGVREGAKCREEWRAAEQRAIVRGADNRQQAEREIEERERRAAQAESPAPRCDGVPRAPRLRNDPFDRDNH